MYSGCGTVKGGEMGDMVDGKRQVDRSSTATRLQMAIATARAVSNKAKPQRPIL